MRMKEEEAQVQMKGPRKGTVTPLADLFSEEEAKKAAKRVEEAISEKESELVRLQGFISDNTHLINLVQKLPEDLYHDIMVPFGKAAFFPGRLIHTNEFLVLLGEGYYAERTSKQTVEILKRRGKTLESQVDSLKAVMKDLKAEASFFDQTASEAAEGLLSIREDYIEESSHEEEFKVGSAKHEDPSYEAEDKSIAVDNEEYNRIMFRLDELEKEELAAESDGENEESEKTRAAFNESSFQRSYDSSLGYSEEGLVEIREDYIEESFSEEESKRGSIKHDAPSCGAESKRITVDEEEYNRIMSRLDELEKEELAGESDNDNDESERARPAFSDSSFQRSHDFQAMKYPEQASDTSLAAEGYPLRNDSTDQLDLTRLSLQSLPRDRPSGGNSLTYNLRSSSPSGQALAPCEVKKFVQAASILEQEVQLQTSQQAAFDSSKAFTGSIIEHADSLPSILKGKNSTSSQVSSSQPSKPISRFKMQRK